MAIGNPFKNSGTQREVLVFMLKLAAIWLSWKGILYVLGEEQVPVHERIFPALSEQWERLNNMMRYVVLNGADVLVQLFGLETENTGYALRVKGYRGVGVGNYCLGFQMIYYFTMLILITPFRFGMKLFAVSTGVFMIVILNIFRVAGVCYIAAFHRQLLPLAHDYFFNVGVLGILLLYYLFLVRRKQV